MLAHNSRRHAVTGLSVIAVLAMVLATLVGGPVQQAHAYGQPSLQSPLVTPGIGVTTGPGTVVACETGYVVTGIAVYQDPAVGQADDGVLLVCREVLSEPTYHLGAVNPGTGSPTPSGSLVGTVSCPGGSELTQISIAQIAAGVDGVGGACAPLLSDGTIGTATITAPAGDTNVGGTIACSTPAGFDTIESYANTPNQIQGFREFCEPDAPTAGDGALNFVTTPAGAAADLGLSVPYTNAFSQLSFKASADVSWDGVNSATTTIMADPYEDDAKRQLLLLVSRPGERRAVHVRRRPDLDGDEARLRPHPRPRQLVGRGERQLRRAGRRDRRSAASRPGSTTAASRPLPARRPSPRRSTSGRACSTRPRRPRPAASWAVWTTWPSSTGSPAPAGYSPVFRFGAENIGSTGGNPYLVDSYGGNQATFVGTGATAPQQVDHASLESQNYSWNNAETLNPSDTVQGDVLQPGQARWFRVPVSPDGTFSATVNQLQFNGDVTLFSDIGQAFTTLTSQKDLTKLSAEFASDAFSPSAFSPSAFSPSRLLPQRLLPERVLALRVLAERVQPGAVRPERVQPECVLAERVQPFRVQPERVLPQRLLALRVLAERLQPERVQPVGVQPERVLRGLLQRADPQPARRGAR